MANSYFKFKQFTIIQNKSAMKVGTDGVLLGAWANCNHAKNILDIGTGTGLIALMLAQKSQAKIDAVEINISAVEEAKLNIQNSPWQNRISVFHTSFQEFAQNSKKKYDLIVSNPPYFTQSKKAQQLARTYARHNDSLSAADLYKGVSLLLADKGELNIIIPADDFTKYIEAASIVQLYCTKILWVEPTPKTPPKRVLLAFEKFDCGCSENTIIIESNGRHQYSDDYKELTKDYYLAF